MSRLSRWVGKLLLAAWRREARIRRMWYRRRFGQRRAA